MLTPEEIQKDITTYRARLANPAGLSQTQIEIYQQAIIEAQQLLRQFPAGAVLRPVEIPIELSPKTQPITPQHHVPPPSGGGAGGGVANDPMTNDDFNDPITTTTKIRHAGPAPTAAPITSRIEVEHNTDPHNPKIVITWSDHYTITVDETAARSNFTNRMRDTCALKCVARDNRFEKIWKYDAPWRAAGFYQALTWFWDGKPPALTQIGITRPTETYKKIFTLITAQAQNVL